MNIQIQEQLFQPARKAPSPASLYVHNGMLSLLKPLIILKRFGTIILWTNTVNPTEEFREAASFVLTAWIGSIVEGQGSCWATSK